MTFKSFTLWTDFRQPVREVFAHLSRHENLAAIFGVPIKTLVAAADPGEPYGVGSVRSIRLGPVRFEETVTGLELDRTIAYRITRGGFVKHHDGLMRFSEHQGGTRVEHTIEMESAIPGLTGLLVPLVERVMRRGYLRLAHRPSL